MEPASAFLDGRHDALLDNHARAVVGQLDAESRERAAVSRVPEQPRSKRSALVDAGHDRRQAAIAAVLAHDGERRREGREAADGQSRPVEPRSVYSTMGRMGKGTTDEPVMNERNSRRSSSESCDMIESTSRTGRLSIVNP